MTRQLEFLIIGFLAVCMITACKHKEPRVLLFTKTAGFYHASIPAGVKAIMQLGEENHFQVDTTSSADWICEDSLGKYAAVIFLNTTGDLLNNYQEADFQRYIQAGGGYVGIHAASDAEYDWGWYNRLVGGYFNGHPEPQKAILHVIDSTNPSTMHLPRLWERTDEWYNFKKLNPDTHVLLTIDEKSYHGGTNGANHPMAWYHDFDGGRAWYTELGHTDESYSDPNYLKHVLGGIEYAIGGDRKLDYSSVRTWRVPDENRFTKTALVQGTFFEPTEMTILPNLDILITQRRGEILLYKNEIHQVKQAGFLNVYFKTHNPHASAEEGVLGIQADPDFNNNHFVYIYYSPADTSVNRLSRFTLTNDSIDLKSEKIVLQLYSQREICCHTGGSVAFGPGGNLFLSTGDNSTPFDEPNSAFVNHGYAPLDDRPGHLQYDSRRGAGNTNDLRGKVLRIKINPDGSYGIPEGNLFPKGEAGTRPEIYVMGDRNPYRISVDKKNGFLYWGEVGPDANNDSLDTRGPRGYDEINQARKAGNFGWPLFVGNNYPYRAYDYATGKSGAAFDPAKPLNESRNNTGLKELPPAQPAFIWYPYAQSADFPKLGSGGRCAMAGPVFYSDLYPAETRMPAYYDRKLFIYDWTRAWIRAVTLTPDGDYENMEPFMQHTVFNAPVDMEMGPDGRIYLLEYGNGWYSKNPDAGLSRLDYNGGNRPPEISGISLDKTSGGLPLSISITVQAKDPENDKLSYEWDLGNGVKIQTALPQLNYTIRSAGDYSISVEVKDDQGASARSKAVSLYAGNTAPSVSILVRGNKTFYFPGRPVQYAVDIEDPDDTARQKDLSDLWVGADYVEGLDKAAASGGGRAVTEALAGKNLMLSLDCKTCHKIDGKSVGPAFMDISKRYQHDAGAPGRLVQKIIQGGSGVWGQVAMSAHPNLKPADVAQIVGWIQSLSAENKIKSLAASGSLNPTLNKPAKANGVLLLSATYSDKGGNNIKSLTGSGSIALRNSRMGFEGIRKMDGFKSDEKNGITRMIVPTGTGWFRIDSIDLSGIDGAAIELQGIDPAGADYVFEWRLDSPEGKKIGELSAEVMKTALQGQKPGPKMVKASIGPAETDGAFHNLYLVSRTGATTPANELSLLSMTFFSASK
jgi:cytochrome c